jgi:hypothetical protein
MLDFDQLATFFRNTRWPQLAERRPTFFSITRFPHYENVLSNVYQFFFDTESPHGLGSLCVDALLDVIKAHKQPSWQHPGFKRVRVERELTTRSGRLDLLLHDALEQKNWQEANTVLLIENKIHHWLANDLGDYWAFVHPESLDYQKIGIVLGLRREEIPPEWRNNWLAITHLEWAQAVERRLGPLVYRAEPRYLTLLLELIENIRTMTNADEDFEKLAAFFEQHRIAIGQAEQIRRQVFTKFPSVLKEALANEYDVRWNAEGNRQGWLWISRRGNHPLTYVLGYYAVFHEDEVADYQPNYRIALTAPDATQAQNWRPALVNTVEAQTHELAQGTDHYVLGKTYQLSEGDFGKLPQLIAHKLRVDWQQLEAQWLDRKQPTSPE